MSSPPQTPLPACVWLQISTLNEAIGATSAIAMQCKGIVAQYLPEIIQAVQNMPLDAVSVSVWADPNGHCTPVTRVDGF